ncbi:DUF4190 domain-containing protein [Arthrobacter sp.]|uniref:DUF4190 domain-containing protein n=1 Tax=Arthrobacter sp. TaxID=1667 RepID=UPI00289A84BE|nr:DUF4190 domain-containing protein [Arthrobacter sp.]
MGSQPNDPMYNYSQGYRPPGPQSTQGRGMALTGLILGIVGLVLFWVPLINIGALIVAVVGLGLSIAALVIAIRRHTSAKGLSIAGIIVSGVAVIGSILASVMIAVFFNTVNDSVNNGSPYGVGPSTSASPSTSAGTTSGSSGSATVAPGADLLPLGTAADIGDYSVTVSNVQRDATNDIVNLNQFNEAPAGQYVLITLDVVYNGADEGDPWLDLTTNFVGSDNRQYDESSCRAIPELPGTTVPTLENGGQAQFQVCMDVPPEAVPGERVLVEETLAFNGPSESSWQTQ